MKCQFCGRSSTMFSIFIYVERKEDMNLKQKGEYYWTWHPANVHDPGFQKVLNTQRQRDLDDPSRDPESIMDRLGTGAEARDVAMMCFLCADTRLADYKLEGTSFKTAAGDRPSRKFRDLSLRTKNLPGERDRQLTRWTQWDLDKQAKIKIDPEVMSKLCIEHAGGEDW
eukprot:5612066-Amphidinium_carterae.1